MAYKLFASNISKMNVAKRYFDFSSANVTMFIINADECLPEFREYFQKMELL